MTNNKKPIEVALPLNRIAASPAGGLLWLKIPIFYQYQ
jgi:hypothetical protein